MARRDKFKTRLFVIAQIPATHRKATPQIIVCCESRRDIFITAAFHIPFIIMDFCDSSKTLNINSLINIHGSVVSMSETTYACFCVFTQTKKIFVLYYLPSNHSNIADISSFRELNLLGIRLEGLNLVYI